MDYGICGFMGHGPLTISITVYIYEGIKLEVLHPKSLPLRRWHLLSGRLEISCAGSGECLRTAGTTRSCRKGRFTVARHCLASGSQDSLTLLQVSNSREHALAIGHCSLDSQPSFLLVRLTVTRRAQVISLFRNCLMNPRPGQTGNLPAAPREDSDALRWPWGGEEAKP